MLTPREGPGLAKVRRIRHVRRRSLTLVALLDAPMAALLASADVLAEGDVREDEKGPRFYGSLDLVIQLDGADPAEVAGIVAVDPHVRLRALRLARREASLRADAPLGTMRAELVVEPREGAVRIHIEVEAEVLRSPRRRTLLP